MQIPEKKKKEISKIEPKGQFGDDQLFKKQIKLEKDWLKKQQKIRDEFAKQSKLEIAKKEKQQQTQTQNTEEMVQ